MENKKEIDELKERIEFLEQMIPGAKKDKKNASDTDTENEEASETENSETTGGEASDNYLDTPTSVPDFSSILANEGEENDEQE